MCNVSLYNASHFPRADIPVSKKWKITPDRIKKMEMMQKNLPIASTFCKAEEWLKTQEKLEAKDIAIMCHRPSRMCDMHVSLYYKPLDDFVVECRSAVPDKKRIACIW